MTPKFNVGDYVESDGELYKILIISKIDWSTDEFVYLVTRPWQTLLEAQLLIESSLFLADKKTAEICKVLYGEQ